MDIFYSRVLLSSDTDEKLVTAQDSLRVAAVRCSTQSAANFNKCKINVFILIIILLLVE